MADVAEARELITVSKQHQRHSIQVAGAWVDIQAGEETSASTRDTDLSYWSELGESYDPEWFPLGVTLPSGA